MPRSIRVRPDLIPRVKLAVKHNGFPRQKDLVEAVGLADSTVRNFLNGKPVDYATFGEICHRLNLEWRDFADLGEIAEPHQESGAAIDVSANELNSEQGVLEQSQPSHPLQGKKENTLEASHPIGAISFLEYFSKTIDQLKSKDLDVRIGAISALGTLAKYSQPAEHWTIMEYLAAFIRTNAPRKEEKEGEEERSPKLSEDIQAALTVIGQRDLKKDPPDKMLNLSNTDLRGADLSKAKLEGAFFIKVNLEKANLCEANLQRAFLNETNLQESVLLKANLEEANLCEANLQRAYLTTTSLQCAKFSGAKLEGADFTEANLQCANFSGAKLEGADFTKASLKGAYFGRANLNRAYLIGANLEEADLGGASLQGTYLYEADLSKAKNLELKEIESAHRDIQTLLPDSFTQPTYWKQFR